MSLPRKPAARPAVPCFSSGPCAKRPGWSVEVLSKALVGRSHRSKAGKARLREVIERSRSLLGLPSGYRLGIVPASDTGAFEMAMWSLLGARGVDVLAWESFGKGWVTDITKQLKLKDVRVHEAGYGELPDLHAVDPARDLVFTWNGTTSGVAVPSGDFIAADRAGIVLCDATSAVLAYELPWERLDVVTYSWQKVMGGEAQHGVLVVGPRAVERLESYTPPWPMPKLFRLTKGGKLVEEVFAGETINTPSMLAVEDALDALAWAESIGGRPALVARARASLEAIAGWVSRTEWVDFLASRPETRSRTSVCLKIVDPWFATLDQKGQAQIPKRMAALLEEEKVAYDVASYRDAPPGIRVWCGATVETGDVVALLPWLDWAYAVAKQELCAA